MGLGQNQDEIAPKSILEPAWSLLFRIRLMAFMAVPAGTRQTTDPGITLIFLIMAAQATWLARGGLGRGIIVLLWIFIRRGFVSQAGDAFRFWSRFCLSCLATFLGFRRCCRRFRGLSLGCLRGGAL